MPWGKKRKSKGKPGKAEQRTSGNGRTMHVHNWVEVNRVAAKGFFRGRDYVFWHCNSKGCANPDKMTIE